MSIIQSGLILNLDAGNTSSYPRTGTIWKDLSGNNNNGTLVNVPTFNSANGGSIVFDGNNNYVSVNDSSTINGTSQTISLWFKNTGIYTTGNKISEILGKHDAYGSYSGYGIILSNGTGNTLLGCYVKNASVNYVPQFSSKIISPLNWYNVTITFTSDSQLTLYLNGSFESSISIGTLTTSNQPFRIGRSNDSYWNSYSGNIGQILIYNRALSPTEVLQNYDATKGRLDTTAQIDCEIIAGGTEVFPNSGTTTFTALYESTCAGGEVSNGPTTGMTITKVGKNGIDTYLITAIPSKGSIFKGWNENGRRTAGTNIYVITYTQLSVNFTISDNTTWFAIFDNDCSNIDIPFCFNINKDNLCLSCNEQKQVYFNNINNQFINNGSNIITSTWFSSANFESLITYERVTNTTRQPFTFNFSSAGVAGAGTFTDVYLSGFKSGKLCTCCSNNLTHKYLSLTCTPSNKNISYTIFLYTNGVKTNTFVRTGDSYINVISYKSDPNQYNNTYKMTYLVSSVMTIDFYASTESIFHYSDCFGGGDNSFQSGVYTRTKNSGSYTTDGWYTQLINGQYSDYNIIYRVYEGQVIDVKDCRSDILDCNG